MKNRVLGLTINILIAAALTYMAMTYGNLSILVMAVSSVFFALQSYKGKIWESAAVLTASAVVILFKSFYFGITLDTVCYSLSTFCLVALGGATIGFLVKYKCSFRTVLSCGTIAYLASFLINFANMRLNHNVNLIEELINRPIAEMFKMYGQTLTSLNIDGAESMVTSLGDIIWYLQQAIAITFPSILIIICLLFTYITFLIFRKVVFSVGKQVIDEYPHFWQLQLPKSITLVFVLLFGITFFIGASTFTSAIINIVIILCAIYFVCGISVIDFFFRKKRIHWFFRILIYFFGITIFSLINLVFPMANIFTILLLAGIADTVSDFRRLRGNRYEA